MLLLKANVVPELNVNVILKQPEDYVDSVIKSGKCCEKNYEIN